MHTTQMATGPISKAPSIVMDKRFTTIEAGVVKAVVDEYTAGDVSTSELGLKYGISQTNVRRILAEQGLCKFARYKTKAQEELLTILESNGIRTPDELRNRLYGKSSAN